MKTIKEQFLNLGNGDMLGVWQEVCELFNLYDSAVYNNDEEFFELFGGTAYEALQRAHFGGYNWSDSFVMFDGYGNFESGNYIEEMIDIDQAVECIEANPERFEQWFDFETDEEE